MFLISQVILISRPTLPVGAADCAHAAADVMGYVLLQSQVGSQQIRG
jgi:hypothetical protein